MVTFARFLLIFTLVVWIGSIIFFSLVVAPAAFLLLPAQQVAGSIVAYCLRTLHLIGLGCGVIFLASTLLVQLQRTQALRGAVLLMILLTAFSQFGVTPQMEKIREAVGGSIQALSHQDAGRAAFDRLHQISVILECLILLAGISAVGLLAAENANAPVESSSRRAGDDHSS